MSEILQGSWEKSYPAEQELVSKLIDLTYEYKISNVAALGCLELAKQTILAEMVADEG